ncbi:MAG: type II secretion system F family protein [Bdellovibrionota bacterium]
MASPAVKMQPAPPPGVPRKRINKSAAKVGFFSPKVKSKDLLVFIRQFSTLISAGVPIVESLKILSDGMTAGLLKDCLVKTKYSVENGRRLAEAMAMHPAVFDRLFCNMIAAGEEAGIIDTILLRLSVYTEKNQKIKNQVKGAMTYPTIIVGVAFAVISGILVFIIPKFQEIFSAAGKEPPWLTQQVVNLSQALIHNWYFFLMAMIGIPFTFLKYIETPNGKIQFDRFIIHAPLIGDVVQKAAIARLCRTLSTLLTSGVGVVDALEIAARTSGNNVVEEALIRCKGSLLQGKPFAQPLTREKIFPPMVVQMISIGEQSGTLDQILGKVADFYEDEVENAVKGMTTIIEPILMVFLGGAIAVILIAMYLPVFKMGDTVG